MPRRTSNGDAPKREAITREIQRRLHEGVYEPGVFLPSERALADEFRVSRPTLRNALAALIRSGNLVNLPGVGTRVAGAGDSRTSAASKAWKILALMLPDIANPFYGEITEAIEFTALQRGYQLLLCNSRHQGNMEEVHIRQLVNHKIDGLILAHDPNRAFPNTIGLIEEAGIPVVYLFAAPDGSSADVVMLDERAGVEQVMRYLFSLGHRRIAFCRPVPGETPHPRELAYLAFLRGKGIEPDPAVIIALEDLDDEHCRKTLERLFAINDPPTAVFGGNDRMALIVLKHLGLLGRTVPDHISLVGFDNLRFTQHLPVPLTTVDQPKYEMGRRAVELLLEQIEIGPQRGPRREIFQPHLIIRDSCSLALIAANNKT